MKKAWQKPELIVLFKVNVSEVVLGNCKVQNALGPITAATGCMNVTGHEACRGHSRCAS